MTTFNLRLIILLVDLNSSYYHEELETMTIIMLYIVQAILYIVIYYGDTQSLNFTTVNDQEH